MNKQPMNPLFTERAVLRLAPLCAAMALSACSFIPTYERPAAPVATSFAAETAVATNPATGAAAVVAADIGWQDFFKDARLKALIALALENNRDLRVAVLAIEQTRAQYQLRRADALPTVAAGVAGSRGPTAAGDIANTYTAGLSVTAYELDFFGRVRALSQAAQAQVLGSEEARKTVQISLIAAVANTYVSLLADDVLLRITRETVTTRQESLRLTQLQFDNDVASKLDLSQAQSLLEGAKAALAQTTRQRAQDENALTLLVGQPLPADLPAGLPITAQGMLPDLPAGMPSELLARRPDIRQAEQQLLSNNANIGAARAAFFPRITLTGSAGVVSNDLDTLFSNGTSAWTFAPQLLLPIFDYGRNQANLESAKVARDIAVAQYEKAIQTGFREVADALAGRATLGEQLRAQNAQLAAEQTRTDLTNLRFKQGASSAFDVLDAQRSLFATQQAAVQVQAQQVQNLVTLYKVLGGGWK